MAQTDSIISLWMIGLMREVQFNYSNIVKREDPRTLICNVDRSCPCYSASIHPATVESFGTSCRFFDHHAHSSATVQGTIIVLLVSSGSGRRTLFLHLMHPMAAIENS